MTGFEHTPADTRSVGRTGTVSLAHDGGAWPEAGDCPPQWLRHLMTLWGHHRLSNCRYRNSSGPSWLERA